MGVWDIGGYKRYRENLEIEIIKRERDLQRQWESRISNVKYNRKYKEIKIEGGGPRYLKKENFDNLR